MKDEILFAGNSDIGFDDEVVTMPMEGAPMEGAPMEGAPMEGAPTKSATTKSFTIKPYVYSPEDIKAFSAYVRKDQELNPGTVVREPIEELARNVASNLSTEYPGLITYEGLRDGTSPFFDRLAEESGPGIAKTSPADRGLTDKQILSIFVTDSEGRTFSDQDIYDSFMAGVARDAAPAAGTLAGMAYGAEKSARLAKSPKGKLVLGILGGLGGAFTGATGGQLLTDELLGEERLRLPGQTQAYEMGKTTAGGLVFLGLPFMIPKGVSLGAAELVTNLAAMGVKKAPRSARLALGVENFLGRTAAQARNNPRLEIGLGLGATAGSTVGAGFAEDFFPDNVGARILSEIAFGVAGTPVGPAAMASLGGLSSVFKFFKKIGNSEGSISGAAVEGARSGLSNLGGKLNVLKTSRQRSGVDNIRTELETYFAQMGKEAQVGQDAVDAAKVANGVTDPKQLEEIREQAEAGFIQEQMQDLIERLGSDKFTRDLVDENGKPIAFTAAGKTGNPVLYAIEMQIDQLGKLGAQRSSSAQKASQALKNLILVMSRTGDQDALQAAGDLTERVFTENIQNSLREAADNVLSAAKAVGGDNPSTNMELSNIIFDVTVQGMSTARRQEHKFWGSIPEVVVPTDAENVPAFISKWDSLTDITKEARDDLLEAFPALNKFVTRKRNELGYATDADGNPIEKSAELTTKELTDLRSMALNQVRNFSSGVGADAAKAHVASQMQQALLEDLLGVDAARAQGDLFDRSDDFVLKFNAARAYSKSLNDVFTRAFGGKILRTDKTGAEQLAPELIAARLLQGGNDPTYLRLKEIQGVGDFLREEKLEGAEEVVSSLLGTTQQIYRNARFAALDPVTGEINPNKLNTFVANNQEVLDLFPDVKKSLENLEDAQVVLRTDTAAAKSRIKDEEAQLSFYNIMNPKMRDADGLFTQRMLGTESPSAIIGGAITGKFPFRNLNRMLKMIDGIADPELAEKARSGMRSAILEYAATKAGASKSGSFSASSLYDSFFQKLPKSEANVNLNDWMVQNNLWAPGQDKRFKEVVGQMVKYEAGEMTGQAGEIVETAGPILDLYASLVGSAVGTAIYSKLGGSATGSIKAAGAGSKAMKEVMLRVPEALRTDLTMELLSNPELLALMLQRPSKKRRKIAIAKRVGTLLQKLGYIGVDYAARPLRAVLPAGPREALRPETDSPGLKAAQEAQRELERARSTPPAYDPKRGPRQLLSPENQSRLDRIQTRGLYRPPAPAPRPAAPAPITGAANPQQRARMQQLFPGDTLMTGIGSLYT
tara:strand:- start:992 stop:4849 length:3858 start_codon:yes stop_codon:yes gene_type:complete